MTHFCLLCEGANGLLDELEAEIVAGFVVVVVEQIVVVPTGIVVEWLA